MLQKYPAHNSLLPFYLAWQLNPTDANYNLSFSYQLPDDHQIDRLVSALQKLVQLKAYLRQTFTFENNQLIANIHTNLPAEINFLTVPIEDLAKIEQELAKEGHNINIKSSIRLNIIRFNNSKSCVIIFNIHHIIMDGFTLDNFIIDLNRLLADEKVDEEIADDYISTLLNEPPLQEATEYPPLDRYIKEINTIADNIEHPPANNLNIVWHYTDVLPDDIAWKLITLSQEKNISVFNSLLLAWGVFISKIYNQKEILVNYPVNTRTHKSIPGCFVNIVVLPVSLNSDDTYSSLIDLWHDKVEIFKQVAKFKLSNQLEIGSIPSFAYSGFTQPHELIIQNNRYISKSYPQIASSNLCIKYREQTGRFLFGCELLSGIFPEYFARSLLKRFFNYLNRLLANSSAQLSEIDLTFVEEKHQLLYDFNNTDAPYPENKTLIDLFDEIVSRYPDKIAVKAFNGEISYAVLNDRAEQLAAFLIEKKVNPDDVIGILIDNRLEMIIAVMAVLKSGAAYLPITHLTPVGNIEYILNDSGVKFLLTLPHLAEGIKSDVAIVDISKDFASPVKYIKPSVKSSNLAYVIYTSGTTGKPKGALIEHKAISNIILYYLDAFKITSIKNCSKYAEFGFDASVIEIFPALLSGATLHIIPDWKRKDLVSVKRFFTESKINFGFLPTQFAELFLDSDNESLDYLIVAGEKLTKYSSVNFHVVNSYGATETSVHVTAFFVDKQSDNIPIGKPISNIKCYVVDRYLNILPIGLIGELVVGGESLARGYLNHSDLTSEKFIPNLFQTEKEKKLGKNTRLYKTGDLVRWLPDGNLEYIGRNDLQVKIRGYRIELAEIESKLIGYPGIEQVVLLVKNRLDSNCIDKYLVAYYVAEEKLDPLRMHEYLEKQLPEYMLPNVFIHLDKLPLTTNDKVDRRILPEPDFENISDFQPPTNEQERLVCESFSKVLGLKAAGVNDDFFRIGGNSIKAITLVVNLQTNFNISVTDIFNLRTPKEIARSILIVKNNLWKHLEKIKLNYKTKKINRAYDKKLQDRVEKYFNSITNLIVRYEKKLLTNVLLTGATGFLGCNLLNQLLIQTDCNIFIPVRAKSKVEAFNRINRKFQFYFGEKLNRLNNVRIFVFPADIEKNDLGLSRVDYQTLIKKIDSIIHSAAFIKHYGEYEQFYSANIKATINLLELSKLTREKDFHYISTISVLNDGYISNYSQYVFMEEDAADILEGRSNNYVKSKHQAEQEVINFRQQGVKSNIYRVGNLVYMDSNDQLQENIDENGFLNRMQCLLRLRVVAETINLEQISAVDLTAQAIIKLFDKQQLSNHTYHVFNPNLYDLVRGFSQNDGLKIRIVSTDQFIDTILNLLDNPSYQKLIERFLLHQGWLNKQLIWSTDIKILQDKTQYILKNLDFEWPLVKNDVFNKYFRRETLIDDTVENIKLS